MPSLRTLPPHMLIGGAILVVCWCFFVVDVGLDLFAMAGTGLRVDNRNTVHLLFEGLAVVGLGFGVQLLVRELRRADALRRDQQRQIDRYRDQFDDVIQRSFTAWNLTEAERDVALLTLRGLSNAAIAELRSTSLSTVKAQNHAIFRKAGVSSRSELMNFFMEEFLDGGTRGSAARPPAADQA